MQTRRQVLSKKKQSTWVKTMKNITKQRKTPNNNKEGMDDSAGVQKESKSVVAKTTIF